MVDISEGTANDELIYLGILSKMRYHTVNSIVSGRPKDPDRFGLSDPSLSESNIQRIKDREEP